jgi:hypothetical protein
MEAVAQPCDFILVLRPIFKQTLGGHERPLRDKPCVAILIVGVPRFCRLHARGREATRLFQFELPLDLSSSIPYAFEIILLSESM